MFSKRIFKGSFFAIAFASLLILFSCKPAGRIPADGFPDTAQATFASGTTETETAVTIGNEESPADTDMTETTEKETETTEKQTETTREQTETTGKQSETTRKQTETTGKQTETTQRQPETTQKRAEAVTTSPNNGYEAAETDDTEYISTYVEYVKKDYSVITEYSDEEYEDYKAVTVVGIPGLVKKYVTVTYSDGFVTDVSEILEIVTSPVNEITVIGTKPVYTYESVTKTEDRVSKGTVRVPDSSMYEGEERAVYGKDGYTENTYRITYKYGNEEKREIISSVTVSPVNDTVYYGTKKKQESFIMPFKTAAQGGYDYQVTQYFGGSNNHGGIDFGVWYGNPITASMSGTVIYAYNDGYFSSSDLRWTYGTYVVIDHGNGYLTYYAHLKSRAVSVGDKVTQGQTIGYSGNTGRVSPAPTAQSPLAGTHLHFEIRKYISGSYVKVNPRDYLPMN